MAAVVTFVVLGVAALLLVLAVVKRAKIYHFLCPNESMPQVCVSVCAHASFIASLSF